MPQPSRDEKPISDGGRMAEVPRRLASASRKGLLMLAMFALGVPVFLVLLGPPIAGGWILVQQYALYRDDGRWREFSLFELTTLTLDEKLAANLRWPGLTACYGFRETQGAGPAGRAAQECPHLGPAQSWLLHPTSSSEWHRRVAGVSRAVPVSSLLFFLGLVLSFLLRLFGANWKFRSPPPPPPPAPTGSSGVPEKLTSWPEPK